MNVLLWKSQISDICFTREEPVVKRIDPLYPHACRRRQIKWSFDSCIMTLRIWSQSKLTAQFIESHCVIEGVLSLGLYRIAQCQCLDWYFKEPYRLSIAWVPNCRSIFFLSLPAHPCAVTYMTEISLTDEKQLNSTYM